MVINDEYLLNFMNFDHKASSKNVCKPKTSRETSSKLVNDFCNGPNANGPNAAHFGWDKGGARARWAPMLATPLHRQWAQPRPLWLGQRVGSSPLSPMLATPLKCIKCLQNVQAKLKMHIHTASPPSIRRRQRWINHLQPSWPAWLRTRSNKLNCFGENLINWTSWKINSMQSRRSSHRFVTSWTDKFKLCAKQWTYRQWSTSFFMRGWIPFRTPLNVNNAGYFTSRTLIAYHEMGWKLYLSVMFFHLSNTCSSCTSLHAHSYISNIRTACCWFVIISLLRWIVYQFRCPFKYLFV